MSQETSQWLNTNTLIGFTEKRGKAWHYRAENQGEQSNHYEGAIPVEDVRRRLFYWKPVEGTMESTYAIIDEHGVETRTVSDASRKTIIRPDTGEILGIFKDGYKIHDFDEWLVKNVERIVDTSTGEGGLYIASAGLLKGGGIAWVQFEAPDTLEVAGFKFRPFITGATSLDGSLSSTYLNGSQAVVCDNTLSCAMLEEDSKRIKVKHSRNSIGKLTDVRQALEIVHQAGDDFGRQVEQLTNTTVTDAQWASFLDEVSSLNDKNGQPKEGRGLTLATNKREVLNRLWNHDQRVAPWMNTAFGAVQAINTATHHEFTVRGVDRAERNAMRAITGGVDTLDQGTLATLVKVGVEIGS